MSYYCCDSSCTYGTTCSLKCCTSYGTCASSCSSCSSYYTYSGSNGYTNNCGTNYSPYIPSNPYSYLYNDWLVGVIVGPIVGAIGLAAIIFTLCWFFKRRHRLSKLNAPYQPNQSNASYQPNASMDNIPAQNHQISYQNLNQPQMGVSL